MTKPTQTISTENTQPQSLNLSGHEILFPKMPYHMADRTRITTADEKLQKAVENATLIKDNSRKQIFEKLFGDKFDDLRALAGDIKQHTLENLDYYLNQFIDNATAAGVQIHFAIDGNQANEICVDIAKKEKCTLCVKSKSMVTEETRLLPKLEEIGVETLETDLGEFILQLDDDAPSHIVTPMIHKDRFAVAKAFQRELGAKYTEDPEELTKIARVYLRDKYQKADLGISGSNFLIAETGSMVICTNEGNGRFCTTAPRVHVAFVGIEKLIPKTQHLGVFLKLLARSSTAQPLTCYTNIITGPKKESDHDGPEKMHIILVDNGRTEILANEQYRQALRCIRCGACLNTCPVYRKISGHSYGAVYSGPIGSVITPLLNGLANYKDLPNASSLCGACYKACPVKINLPLLLIKLRRDTVTNKYSSVIERLIYKMYATSLNGPTRYNLSNFCQKHFLRLVADKDGFVHNAPPPAKPWTDQRDLPAPAKQSFRKWWAKNKKND